MRIDVRVKFILLAYANILLLFRTVGWLQWGIVFLLVAAFILQGFVKKGLIYLGIFSFMSFFDAYVFDLLEGDWSSLASMLMIGGRLMLPCFMAGSLILSTTAVHELISIFRRMRIPEGVILTLAVMMRFMPTVRFELQRIRQSLALRGVFPTFWSKVLHPIHYFEYCMVPLMMAASRVAQDLTIATLTKGVGIETKRSSYKQYRFSVMDWGILGILLAQVILVEVFK